jgi:hypothetical protein
MIPPEILESGKKIDLDPLAADKRQQQEQVGLQGLIATTLHNHFGQEIQNKPDLREEAQYQRSG